MVFYFKKDNLGFPGGSMVKNSPAMQEKDNSSVPYLYKSWLQSFILNLDVIEIKKYMYISLNMMYFPHWPDQVGVWGLWKDKRISNNSTQRERRRDLASKEWHTILSQMCKKANDKFCEQLQLMEFKKVISKTHY